MAEIIRYHCGTSAQVGRLGQNQRKKRLTKKEKEALRAAERRTRRRRMQLKRLCKYSQVI
jgi:hypothetical protein